MHTARSSREHKLSAVAPALRSIRLAETELPIAHTFVDKAAEVADYYGFTKIEPPRLSRDDVKEFGFDTPDFLKEILGVKNTHLALRPESKIPVMRHYMQRNLELLPQPLMLFYPGSTFPGSRRGAKESMIFGLEVIGSPKSIAEALVLKTAMVILSEAGFKNLSIEINSLGDKDSTARFVRELGNFYRKQSTNLTKHCRENLKRDPLSVLACENQECQSLKLEAPKSVSYLTEPARRHFREVLEYMESMQVPYRLRHTLMCNRNCYSKSLFEIHEQTPDTEGSVLLARGGRYDTLARRFGAKKDVPAVGITVAFDRSLEPKNIKIAATRKPKCYFVQLGFEAKLKSLEVIEMLRQAKIPILQALPKDKLAAQLTVAEDLKIPYTIIMGQKEALEKAVIVRNMATRSQETVTIANLSAHLKALR